MLTTFQCFIRNGVLLVECRETDDLGRELPACVELRDVVSPALRTAIDDQVAEMLAAQQALVDKAKADVAAGRPAPRRLTLDRIADEADRKETERKEAERKEAEQAAEQAATKETKP